MHVPGDDSQKAGWPAEASARLRVYWPAKLIGTTSGMTLFFVAYFWVLNNPLFPVTTMPLTTIDHAIAFRPESLALYFSLWVYVSLGPGLIGDRRELFSYGLAAAGLGAVGLAIFVVWPTAVPGFDIDWSQHRGFGFLHTVDATGNACPSLHVAFAVFTAAWIDRALRLLGAGRVARGINWVWCAGILYSTVATRQHVALDVIAGAVLGATAAVLHLRWVRRHCRGAA
jgi:membrane-associated phospholipid phosphatase